MKKRNVVHDIQSNKHILSTMQNIQQNKAKTTNKNLFAGDSEFKMNFWLKFLNSSTYNRFIKDKSFRNIFIYKIYFFSILVLPILIQLVYEIDYKNLSISLLESFVGWVIFKFFKSYRIILKSFHLLYSITIIYLFKKELEFFVFYIFQLEEFASSAILLFYWPHYSLITTINIFTICWISSFNFKKIIVFIIISLFLNLIYACIERVLKEDWVLFDSFKKSENSYNSLINEIYLPIFVINEQSDILFRNSASAQFIEAIPNKTKMKNFIKMESLSEYELNLTKCLKTNQNTSAKICLEFKSSNNEESKNVICFCKIKFRKVNWKGRSNRILMTLKNINTKIEKETLLKNELVQIDNNLENTQNYLEKMAKISGATPCKKLIFSLKSENSRLTAIIMGKSKSQTISFKISDYLIRLFDIFFSATGEKKIMLKLIKDAYFPEVVTGNFRQFDIAMSMLLSFILVNGNFVSVDLSLRMLDTTVDEYILLFKFQCFTSVEFTDEFIKKIIDHSTISITKLSKNTDLSLTQDQIDLIYCKKIVETDLNGSFGIDNLLQNQLYFEVKLRFSRDIDNKNCRTFTLFSPKSLASNSSTCYQWNSQKE